MAESHKQSLHPKEEQHAGSGGHLFSQVCSPSVIKIGATHPTSDAALVLQICVFHGHERETRGTVVPFWSRWK